MAVSPASRARRATSSGATLPSEAVEWQCRSTSAVRALRRRPGGLGMAPEIEQRGVGELGEGGVRTPVSHGRVAREAPLARGSRAGGEGQAELILAVDGAVPRGRHRPGLTVDLEA